MPHRILVAAVVALALAPSAAAAAATSIDPTPLTSSRITESVRIAEDFWGTTPVACPSGIEVYSASITDDPEIAGFTSPEGAPCSIWIAEDMLADTDWTARVETCDLIVHEMGHLLGMRYADNPDDPIHSADPRSIMNAAPSATVRACNTRFRPRAGKGQHHSRVVWATR